MSRLFPCCVETEVRTLSRHMIIIGLFFSYFETLFVQTGIRGPLLRLRFGSRECQACEQENVANEVAMFSTFSNVKQLG